MAITINLVHVPTMSRLVILCGFMMVLSPCSGDDACRDRRLWPFSSTSIWNTAIGFNAQYEPANIYQSSQTPQPPPHDGCAAAKADPSTRTVCPSWVPNYTQSDCLKAGCCYDDGPNPDPNHYAWCFVNQSNTLDGPDGFYVDTDYFISTSTTDPMTPFIDQGWWGQSSKCGTDHCCITGKTVGSIPFPYDQTFNLSGNNNAAAVLMPDNTTLVQFQPLYRCTPGSPVLSLAFFLHERWSNVSIVGEGTYGAHGGSHLSSIGGTIRRGELQPDAPPIPHAIKLMLFAKDYYFPGNKTVPCYRWPATNCDGNWNASTDPTNANYYNGSNPSLKPGALLAVPPTLAGEISAKLQTQVAQKLLAVLTDFGGYLDDNTASNNGAFNVQDGVEEEVARAYNGLSLRPSPNAVLYADLVQIYKNLHIVQNNGPINIGGGGVRRRPTAPPICSEE